MEWKSESVSTFPWLLGASETRLGKTHEWALGGRGLVDGIVLGRKASKEL